MSMNADLHNPASATARTISGPSRTFGVLTFTAKNGSEVEIFTTVQAAHAMADAFNAAMAEPA